MISQAPGSESEKEQLEGVTLAAARAAEQGQWDRVEECYQEREAALRRVVLSQDQIERLLTIDRRIQAQAFIARAAVAEQLRRSFATRLTLKGLRAGIGEPESGSGTVRIKA